MKADIKLTFNKRFAIIIIENVPKRQKEGERMKHEIIVDTPENVRKILQNERDETQRASYKENVNESRKLAEQFMRRCDNLGGSCAILLHLYLHRMNIRLGQSTSVDFYAIIPRDDEIAQALQEKGWKVEVEPGTGFMKVSNFFKANI